MLKYLGLRLLASIPVLLVASFAVFCLVAVSGDPLANLREQSGVSEATIQARAEALHLNDSLFQRYGYRISDALRGDFGSALDGESVIDKLARSAGVTLRMVIVAAIVALVLAIVVGVGSALREGSVLDHSATLTVFVCFSMPVFFLAGVLKDVAIRVNEATGYRIFATVGERGVDDMSGFFAMVGDRASHLVLPAATLVLVTFAAWSRYQRSSMWKYWVPTTCEPLGPRVPANDGWWCATGCATPSSHSPPSWRWTSPCSSTARSWWRPSTRGTAWAVSSSSPSSRVT